MKGFLLWNGLRASVVGVISASLLVFGCVSCAPANNSTADDVEIPSALANSPAPKGHVDFDTLDADEQHFIKNFIQQERFPYNAFKDSFEKFITDHPKLHGFIEYYVPKKSIRPILILRNWNFSADDLADANFVDSVLLDLCFHQADLSRARFAGALVQDTDFTDASLSSAHFLKVSLVNDDFTDASLSSVHFGGTTLRQVNFKHSDLGNVHFNGGKFSSVTAEYADFNRALFTDVILDTVDFKHADLGYATFSRSQLQKVDFTDADCSRTKFSHGKK